MTVAAFQPLKGLPEHNVIECEICARRLTLQPDTKACRPGYRVPLDWAVLPDVGGYRVRCPRHKGPAS